MMNNVFLKRPFHALALIAVVAILPTFGFTNKVGNGMNIVHSRSNFALSIASVSEENTPAVSDAGDPQPKSYLDDGFVFGLNDSGLDRPKGKQAQVVVEGDTLETQPWQVAAVLGTFLGHAAFASNAFVDVLSINDGNIALTSVESFALLVSGWLLADLGSGVLHWSVDNYGNGRTPIMGGLIAAFQGHHSAPWTITERGFCNNVCKLCVPFGIIPMAVINFISGPFVTMFFTFFCVMEIMSQEFHKWSHMTKSECTPLENMLQNNGLTIGRKAHAQHHLLPYDGNYCIVSGVWSELLDSSGFFRRLEHVVYNYNGVESNAWKLDPQLRESTLRGEYLPKKTKRRRTQTQQPLL